MSTANNNNANTRIEMLPIVALSGLMLFGFAEPPAVLSCVSFIESPVETARHAAACNLEIERTNCCKLHSQTRKNREIDDLYRDTLEMTLLKTCSGLVGEE